MPYRSVTHGGITLLCFPPYDLVFAEQGASRLRQLATQEPQALQEALAVIYPDVLVRARDTLAALGDGPAWYAYRDGRYSPFTDTDPWWEAEDAARIVIDADGRYVDADASALALIGVDIKTLRTLATGDLTDPAVRPTVPWIWALLQDVGVLHSTSILVTPDGRRIPVEYRLVLGGAGDGSSISYLRAVPIEAAAVTDEA